MENLSSTLNIYIIILQSINGWVHILVMPYFHYHQLLFIAMSCY
jgi:hypothetical protein